MYPVASLMYPLENSARSAFRPECWATAAVFHGRFSCSTRIPCDVQQWIELNRTRTRPQVLSVRDEDILRAPLLALLFFWLHRRQQ